MPTRSWDDPSDAPARDQQLSRRTRRGLSASRLGSHYSASALQREWADLEADVQELVSNPALKNLPEVRALKERLQDSLHRASEAVANASHGFGMRVRHTATATNEYVHAEPWKVAGMAGLVGLVVGLLLARR